MTDIVLQQGAANPNDIILTVPYADPGPPAQSMLWRTLLNRLTEDPEEFDPLWRVWSRRQVVPLPYGEQVAKLLQYVALSPPANSASVAKLLQYVVLETVPPIQSPRGKVLLRLLFQQEEDPDCSPRGRLAAGDLSGAGAIAWRRQDLRFGGDEDDVYPSGLRRSSGAGTTAASVQLPWRNPMHGLLGLDEDDGGRSLGAGRRFATIAAVAPSGGVSRRRIMIIT